MVPIGQIALSMAYPHEKEGTLTGSEDFAETCSDTRSVTPVSMQSKQPQPYHYLSLQNPQWYPTHTSNINPSPSLLISLPNSNPTLNINPLASPFPLTPSYPYPNP